MPNTPKLPESIKNYLIIPFMESCNCSQHSIDGVVEIFEKAIAQELSTLKAQVRKEIAELKKPIVVKYGQRVLNARAYNDALDKALNILKEE